MKTALVTGGSRGIGAAICRELAQEGCRVAVNYSQRKDCADNLVRELTEMNQLPHLAVRADVASLSQVQEMFRQVGPVEILVNNAGIAQQKLFTDLTPEDWRRMFAVHVDGSFFCCQSALPHMIAEKRGCIVNVSSMWGQVGASCEVHYSAAKAAMLGLTMALAKELGPSGIRVNAVAPGVIQTDMLDGLDDASMQALQEETPLCRIGEPRDIAKAVAFLASDNAAFVTGQTLGVNGGFVVST